MQELTLEYDQRMSSEMKKLMIHYNVNTKAELIAKAIAVLKTAAHINQSNGELIARKGNLERKIVVT